MREIASKNCSSDIIFL